MRCCPRNLGTGLSTENVDGASEGLIRLPGSSRWWRTGVGHQEPFDGKTYRAGSD